MAFQRALMFEEAMEIQRLVVEMRNKASAVLRPTSLAGYRWVVLRAARVARSPRLVTE